MANLAGNKKKVWDGVRKLSGKVNTKPPINLTCAADGSSIDGPEQLVAVWVDFLEKKFAATQREVCEREEWEELPTRDPENKITRKEFTTALGTMKRNKAVGPDNIPIEVFKTSEPTQEMLLQLLSEMWEDEVVPEEFARAVFIMLYKNKGSKNDPSKYRCIGLLNHCYKMLSTILLGRIQQETNGFLSDWQAGFRKLRGCRDNILILRTLVEQAMAEGKELALTFIDYSAAFDSVSHKFIDQALADAGAKPKTRAMFRAVYRAASAMTKVEGPDGKQVFSMAFPVRRGVIQGDITSPIYFILALEKILRKHDKNINKGTRMTHTHTWVHTLGYADDAVLVDEQVETATKRVNDIAKGSRKDADMNINVTKTQCMHLRKQDALRKPTKVEAASECKFTCSHKGCNKLFANKHGLRVHEGKCPWKDEYDIERILDVKVPKNNAGKPIGYGNTQFKIRWAGYNKDHDTWEPYKNIHLDAINEFLITNNMYDFDWKYRCPHCNKPAASERGVKIHCSKAKNNCKSALEDLQNFTGTEAERKAKETQKEEQQQLRPAVKCEGRNLVNCYKFRYLGSIFAADGSNEPDIRRRIGIAQTRAGQLRHIFGSPKISVAVKLKLYNAAVGSLFTYGCEGWTLTPKMLRRLNGANSKLLAHFTGNDIITEARSATTSYNLNFEIRKRRLCWLGHILRMSPGRLVRRAVVEQFASGGGGNIFMDAPHGMGLRGLTKLAFEDDKKEWRNMVRSLNPAQAMTTTKLTHTYSLRVRPETPRETAHANAADSATGLTIDVCDDPIPDSHFLSDKSQAALIEFLNTGAPKAEGYYANGRAQHAKETSRWASPANVPTIPTIPTIPTTPPPDITETSSPLWAAPAHMPTPPPSDSTETNSSLWAVPACIPTDSTETKSSLWAAPAYIYTPTTHIYTTPPYIYTPPTCIYTPPPSPSPSPLFHAHDTPTTKTLTTNDIHPTIIQHKYIISNTNNTHHIWTPPML